MIELTLKTYTCPTCEYKQDFDPNNAQLMAIHFRGIPAGNCPACFMGKTKTREKKVTKMQKETRPEKKIKCKVLEDSDIEELEETELDEDGKEVKRKLTKEEKDRKKAERDASLAKLQGLIDEE